MKKLILLGALLLGSLLCIFAGETQNNAIALQSSDNFDNTEDEKHYELLPKNHKTFFLSVANQITLINKLLASKGTDEVIRYFLSLKNHSEVKALELLTKDGSEDLRLVILENLPVKTFAELLKTLFEPIGGEAISHWGYKNEKNLDKAYMTPAVRAQQYINFFMQYNIVKEIEKTNRIPGKLYGETEEKFKEIIDNEEALQSRGKKIAKILNALDKLDDSIVIDLLYGREDTRFIGDRDRMHKKSDKIVYQTFEKAHNDRDPRWYTKDKNALDKFTQGSRVYTKSINYIIPHLDPRLIVAVFAKETNGNNAALISLIKSIGCEKAFGELFEYLDDNIKDKVFETCSDEASILDIVLDKTLETTSDNLAQLGDGSDKKDL